MDTARIRRELTGSFRLLWTKELWLWSGAVTVLAGFVLWVGATGAAITYGADFAGLTLSVKNWSSLTTVVFGVVAVLWLLAPAALVTYLVHGRLTNVSGNLHTHYRVQHPSLLVAPLLILFAVGLGAGVVVGSVGPALAGVLVALGLLVAVRTVTYSYRAFSFSYPLVPYLFLFASLVLVAVTILSGAGLVAGRRPFVEAAATGVGDLLGTGAVSDLLLGTSTLAGGTAVPTLLAVTALLPVGSSLAYVLVQSLAGAVERLREPDVPRSKLRTGQRYPDFARPISEKTAGGRGATGSAADTAESGSSGTAAADGSSTDASDESPAATADASGDAAAATGDTAADDGADDEDEEVGAVSHTRVFDAPDDGEFEDVPGVEDVPDAGDAGGTTGDATAVEDAGEETAVVDGGYQCPTCAKQFDPDTDFAYCPTCGTELEPQ